MRSSELEKLLHEIGLEGRVDSSGKFTLAVEALRQKFAGFQFEGPSQWVLKVIQALVGAKADSCDIRSSYQRTEFLVHSSKCLFSADEIEQAFLAPQVDSSSAIWDLMSALWFLSFNLQVAWLWTNLNSDDGVVWTGAELKRIKVEPTTFSILEISHPQSPKEGSWLVHCSLRPV